MTIGDFSVAGGMVLCPPNETFPGFAPLPPGGPYLSNLSYISDRARDGKILAIRTLETGQTRELHPKLSYFQWPTWAPDGRSFAAQGTDPKGRQGIHRIDAETGETEAIVDSCTLPQWSPDGKKIFCIRRSDDDEKNTIIDWDIASGTEREILRGKALLALSAAPDGRYLAVVTTDPATRVLIVPVAGGETREMVRLNAPELISNGLNAANNHNITWTPDGKSILFHKIGGGLWLVPAAGGQPRNIDLGVAGARGLHIHPNGRQVVFVAPDNPTNEVWVMENWLAGLSAKK
ncbi:MAG: PD40 domain-containing protein [Acidobacteria bacterium]|nr:PD40 domain-containing protein [Acidobacteriota bacterium]